MADKRLREVIKERIASYAKTEGEFSSWLTWYCHHFGYTPSPDRIELALLAFSEGWARAEKHIMKESASEFIGRRISEIFIEVKELEGNPDKLSQGKILLLNVWRQYAERELDT